MEFLAQLCLFLGVFVIISGALGAIRFPDFFSRCHAVGMTDSLGLPLVLLGLILHMDPGILWVKIVLLGVFSMLTSATATHALAKAALAAGVKPLEGKIQIKREQE